MEVITTDEGVEEGKALRRSQRNKGTRWKRKYCMASEGREGNGREKDRRH